MKPGRLSAAAAMLGAGLASPAMAEVGPHALMDVAENLLRIYNAGDASALHGLLAPALQARYTPEDLRRALLLCRVLTGDIFRLSTPSWGTRSYGFFGLYAETGVFDMVLEIDPTERIVHWVIADDVTATEQQCHLGQKGDGAPVGKPVP